MTTNIADVLKLAAKPVLHDNDERTLARVPFSKSRTTSPWWTRSTSKLLHDAESQPVANLPAGKRRTCSDHPNAESHIVRPVGDIDNWKELETCATRTEQKRVRGVETAGCRECAEDRGSEIRDAAADNPAKFEETWKSWEHQVGVHENLSSSKLGDDVKISWVLREAPQKLRNHLLANSGE